MVVAKKCTQSPGRSEVGVHLAPLLLVFLLCEATHTVEVKRLETLALALLVGGKLVLDRLKTDTAFADADDNTAARGAFAIGVVLLGEGETDFGDVVAARWFVGVFEEVLLLLENVD